MNLTLLCTHHPTLLHEGGFSIHRDSNGGIYFKRPDGRVIPRSGYRADDMLDDVAIAPPGENASARVRMAAIVHAYTLDDEPSAEGWIAALEATATPVTWTARGAPGTTRTDSVQNPSAEGYATRMQNVSRNQPVAKA